MIGEDKGFHEIGKIMPQKCFLIIFKVMDQVTQRIIIKAGAPGKIKMRFDPAAWPAPGMGRRRPQVTRTFEAERRDVGTNGLLTAKTHSSRWRTSDKIFPANQTMGGINELG